MTALQLSVPQFEVARHAGQGLTHPEVAEALGITPRTAKHHALVVVHKLRDRGYDVRSSRRIWPVLRDLIRAGHVELVSYRGPLATPIRRLEASDAEA